MKKVFAVLCCILLLFSVVSCGNSKEKLVTAPSEDYVIECLKKVPGILDIEAVTEDNDPMKNLNKPGWYTAHIYFSYKLVNQDDVYGDDLIDKGTDAGGSIEVYKTKNEADKRNEYLSAFDGGVLDSGSHTVIGTLVVRTSDELTSSEQSFLETNIIHALYGELDEIEAIPGTLGAMDSIPYPKGKYYDEETDEYYTYIWLNELMYISEVNDYILEYELSGYKEVACYNKQDNICYWYASESGCYMAEIIATESSDDLKDYYDVQVQIYHTTSRQDETRTLLDAISDSEKYNQWCIDNNYYLTPNGLASELLSSYQYTADYVFDAVSNADIDWLEHATSAIYDYNDGYYPEILSPKGYSDELKYSGFDPDIADLALSIVDVDWSELSGRYLYNLALDYSYVHWVGLCVTHKAFAINPREDDFECPRCGGGENFVIEVFSLSRENLIDMLVDEGFSKDEAELGITVLEEWYCPNIFSFTDNKEGYFAAVILCYHDILSEEEAKSLLKEYGYSEHEISYAIYIWQENLYEVN